MLWRKSSSKPDNSINLTLKNNNSINLTLKNIITLSDTGNWFEAFVFSVIASKLSISLLSLGSELHLQCGMWQYVCLLMLLIHLSQELCVEGLFLVNGNLL